MVRRTLCLLTGWAALFAATQPALAQARSDTQRKASTLGLDLFMAIPAENPVTPDRVKLGAALFSDPVLSGDGRVSCASCHRAESAFADTVAASAGAFGRRTARNAPSLLNAGFLREFFWDGRTTSLEEQVLQPITHPLEMAADPDSVLARLLMVPTYRAAFTSEFGGVTRVGLARALASYVRTLQSGGSRADRYFAGDSSALDSLELAGFRLFIGRANCSRCHGGPLLTDGDFHNTGVSADGLDSGRYAVTQQPSDRGRFRTPSLRNVARSAPYMHDGSVETLEAVLDLYDRGGNPNPNLDAALRPLRFTSEERSALIAFLRALNSESSARSAGDAEAA
jgi:cytochrome c peroxidase